MKILLLEDNKRLSNVIIEALTQANYKVNAYENGKDALTAIDDGYDCFILDINVPGVDGLTLLKEIRLLDKTTPAIIISANIELETIRKAYGKGCDEYLKKPFYIDELEFKVNKLCKPKTSLINLPKSYTYNINTEELFDYNNEPIKLAKKEILFMNLMVKNLDKIVNFEAIEQYVWEGELTTVENIRALIKRIRKKLPPETIISQGGMGYKLSYM